MVVLLPPHIKKPIAIVHLIADPLILQPVKLTLQQTVAATACVQLPSARAAAIIAMPIAAISAMAIAILSLPLVLIISAIIHPPATLLMFALFQAILAVLPIPPLLIFHLTPPVLKERIALNVIASAAIGKIINCGLAATVPAQAPNRRVAVARLIAVMATNFSVRDYQVAPARQLFLPVAPAVANG